MSGSFVKVWGVVGLSVASLIAGWSYAQRDSDSAAPETLLPAQSIIYLKTDGTLLHAAAYEKTAAYEALVKSGLQAKIDEIFATMSPSEEAKELAEAGKFVQEHGMSLGITIDPPVQGPPQPWGVIVLHDAAGGIELVDRLIKKIPGEEIDFQDISIAGRNIKMAMIPDSPIEVGYWAEQGHLMIAVGIRAVEAAVNVAAGERENLSTSPLYKRYSSKEEGVAFHTTGWLEFESLRGMFGRIPVPAPGANPDEPVTVNDLAQALGLHNLNHIASRAGYKGPATWSEVIVDAPGKKTGLLSLIEQESLTLDDIPPIPTGHNGFVVSSFDWTKAYDALLEVCFNVAKFGPPNAEEQITRGLTEIERELGLNLRDDLLAHIGNVNCIYTDAKQGIFGIGSTVLMSVKNQTGLKKSLVQLMKLAEKESRGQVRFSNVEKAGETLTLLQIPEAPVFSPAICVTEDWIIIGILPQAVEATLMRLDGTLPSWKADAEYKAAFAALPEEFTALSAVEPRGTYQFLLSAAPSLVGFAEMGIRESGQFPEDFKIPFSPADIPPAEVVTAPLFPNLAVTTTSANGIHMYSRQSLIGFPILGGGDSGTTVATTAVLVALLLPAIQQAREAARRAQSSNNIKQILIALHNYHDVNNRLPAGTIENKALKPEERLSWLVDILPYIEEQALWAEINMKEGWESEANQFGMETRILGYQHPSAPSVREDFYGWTNYAGMGGVGADAPTLPVKHPRAGVFGYDRATRFRDIIDGMSNTIAVTEVVDAGPWGAGGKPTIRSLTQKPYINGPDGISSPGAKTGVNVGMCDGSVRYLSDNIDETVLEYMSTIAGGEVIGDF